MRTVSLIQSTIVDHFAMIVENILIRTEDNCIIGSLGVDSKASLTCPLNSALLDTQMLSVQKMYPTIRLTHHTDIVAMLTAIIGSMAMKPLEVFSKS